MSKPLKHQVGVTRVEYDEMMKECRRKGHTFTIDKFGHKTLVKIYDNNIYEYVKGKRDREIVVLDDIIEANNFKVTSPFMKLVLHFKNSGMDLTSATNLARMIYTDMCKE